jgi:hypothetical protein
MLRRFVCRGIAEFQVDAAGSGFVVRSTGNQRSSRLLSMRSADALVVLVRLDHSTRFSSRGY